MKIKFTHDGIDGWFDPENYEYEYDGDSGIIEDTLANMEYLGADIESEPRESITDLPGETWVSAESEAIKQHVLANLSWVRNVEIHDD